MVQILMKNPSIQPDHQYLVSKDNIKNLGGTNFNMLNNHIGTSTRNSYTQLKAQLLNITTLMTAIPKYGK